jgi:tripartite-type tricarboxylate transporter receptor subunit TctC
MTTKTVTRILCSALLTHLVMLPDFVYSQTDFYRGKTITIIHGRAAGGTGDFRVRAVAPYLQKYIPGNPTIVHEYMDGGGGRKATNHIFNTARPDGLTIGNVSGSAVASALFGEIGVQYDIDKLHFVGSPDSAVQYLLLTRREAGFRTLDKLRQASGVRFGGLSVGHTLDTVGRMMAWFLGLKEIKEVTGFSAPERRAALMRGEIDGYATPDDFFGRTPEWLDQGLVDLHLIFAIPREEKHPRFSHLPELDSFVKTERERKLLTMFRTFRLTGAPFILPPAMPKDRVEIIKEALRKSFKDPEFFKEYRKMVGDDATPLMPEANEKAIRDLPRDAETIELYKKLAGAGPLQPR